jgi:hypothetical protein
LRAFWAALPENNKEVKKTKRNNRPFRAFLASLFVSLAVLALLWGIAFVDYQCRKIGFGDEKTLIFQITGKNLNIACIAAGICYNNSCD